MVFMLSSWIEAVSALRATLSASHSVIAFTVTNTSKELTGGAVRDVELVAKKW